MAIYLLALAVIAVAAMLAFGTAALFHLHGTPLVVMLVVILSIGIAVAAAILVLHFRARKRQAQEEGSEGGAGSSEIDVLLNDANRKLRASQQGAKSLDDLPLLYILGDAGSAKTSLILRSGLDPELIAGSAPKETEVLPTPLLNLWFTRQAAFLEAGEAVRQSTGSLRKLIGHTRPRAYRSVLGSAAPARAAVVCVSAEQLLTSDASASSLASARATGAQLREISRLLGAALPIYVIITKLDRVPHFSEFVQNLSDDEARQVFGFTVPRNEASAGVYTDKATRELNQALDSLYFNLGEFRVEMLDRETEERNAPGVYEFPREFGKLRRNLVQYLVELCKPSQLNANPYLRGFYFTGVRARVVEQSAHAPAALIQTAPQEVGATTMFSVQDHQSVQRPAQHPGAAAAKVRASQWTFLPKLFPEVILNDKSALSASQQTAPARLFRRTLFGALAAMFAICALLLFISFLNNQGMERRIENAARALPSTAPTDVSLSRAGDLQQLDNLRALIVQLDGYNQYGPPWTYRIGLYQGDKLAVRARRIYFDRFRPMLLNPAQAGFTSYLRTLPDKPSANTNFSDYATAYSPLKAYLMTAGYHDKSNSKFLTPVILQYWAASRSIDPPQQQLAGDQVDFYGGELLRQDPYAITADGGVVQHAREYLSNFGAVPRIYQDMLAAAEKTTSRIDFNSQYPGSAATVVDAHLVRGAFTRSGFDFMQGAVQRPNDYFHGETWVLGDRAAPSLDNVNVSKRLAGMYSSEFIKEWHSFVNEAKVARCGDLRDAQTKLDALSASNSPLLALFYTVSHNTSVPDQQIKSIFQPAQVLADPNVPDRFFGAGNASYVSALLSLSGAVAQVAQNSPSGSDAAAFTPIVTAASAADSAARQSAFTFNVDPKFEIGKTLLTLMEAPIRCAQDLVPSPGSAANAAGQKLCATFSPLLGKFPFSPSAKSQASVTEVNQFFAPETGALWTTYGGGLKPYFTQQGSQFVPTANAPQPANPAFAAYLSRLGKISSGLYSPGSQGPSFHFMVRFMPGNSKGVESASLVVDGQQIHAGSVSQDFTWNGATAHQASLVYDSNEALLMEGNWALFQLIAAGEVTRSQGVLRVDFPIQVETVVAGRKSGQTGSTKMASFEITGPGAEFLAPGGLSGLHCVTPVVNAK